MKELLIAGILLCYCVDIYAAEEKEAAELEPIVITPWRIEESYYDVSRNVTVITQDGIKKSAARYLPELIENTTGVVVSDYYGNPKGTVVDIRGFGETSVSNVLVLVNGRRTNQVDLSGADWAQIDLNAIDRIEIVKGPSTVLYGDNASGGVINIITKKGTSEKPTVKVAGELGSYQYHKAYTNLSGLYKMKEDNGDLIYLDYFFSFSNQNTTGYRANNGYWANDYFGSAAWRLADMLELSFSAGYHRDRYGMPGALYLNGNPYALAPKGINQIGRRGTAFPDDNGFTSDYFIIAEPRFIFFLAGNEVTASVFSSFRERRSKGLNIPEPDIWGTPHSEYETCHHITTYELRPKLETSLLWKEIDNKFIMGLDYFYAKDDVLSGNRINNQQDETDIHKETMGIYMHDNIKLSENILFNAGARGEWADYTFNQKRLIYNHATKQLKEAAFNFGMGYKYNDRSQIYADISRSYRFPNTEEYYQNKYMFWGVEYGGLNTNIKHQQAINYEIGVKDLTLDWLHINGDIFLMDVRDEIYYDPSTWLNSNYSPKTRHYGLELEAKLNLLDGNIRPFGNWAIQKSFFKGGPYTANQVPFVPKNKISAGITLSPFKKLDWTTTFDYTGSRFKISDQKNIAPKLKDFAVFNTKLDYTYKSVNLWAAIKNIFDKKYYAYGVTNSTATSETFYPAPERSFEAGATLTF